MRVAAGCRDVPEYKYTLAFLGYGPEEDNCVIELTYNYGKTEYAKGNAYAQVRVRDVVPDGQGGSAATAVLCRRSTDTVMPCCQSQRIVSAQQGLRVF
jgi:hypothetical protein